MWMHWFSVKSMLQLVWCETLKVEFCLTHLNATKKAICGYKFVCECILDVAYFLQEGVWKWGMLLTSFAANLSIQLLCTHTCFWAYCTCVCTWGRVEKLYRYMRVCVCVNNGIVSSFIVFWYMHECQLMSIVVMCMSYRLRRVDFISKDERDMLTDYCMRCEILVAYAKNHQVVVYSYVWLSSQVIFLKYV